MKKFTKKTLDKTSFGPVKERNGNSYNHDYLISLLNVILSVFEKYQLSQKIKVDISVIMYQKHDTHFIEPVLNIYSKKLTLRTLIAYYNKEFTNRFSIEGAKKVIQDLRDHANRSSPFSGLTL